jgi:LysM repeat protein
MADTEVATIRELNPALLGNATPAGNAAFSVKLPVAKAVLFAKAYNAGNERFAQSTQSVTHKVKKGETLISIARRYGQEVGALMKFNGLTSARLYAGQQLTILLQNLSGNLK